MIVIFKLNTFSFIITVYTLIMSRHQRTFSDKEEVKELYQIFAQIGKVKQLSARGDSVIQSDSKKNRKSANYSAKGVNIKAFLPEFFSSNTQSTSSSRGLRHLQIESTFKAKKFISTVHMASNNSKPDLDNDLVRFYQSLALSESTRKAYTRGWDDFQKWALTKGVATKVPIEERIRFQFLADISAKTGSWPKVNLALQGIKYQYRINQVAYPTPSISEKDLLEGIQRSLRKENRKVHALSPSEALSMAKKLLPNDWKRTRYFKDHLIKWREAALLLLSFYCVSRFLDVPKLTTANLSFERGDLIIQFGGLKNNKKGELQSGLVEGVSSGFCMV